MKKESIEKAFKLVWPWIVKNLWPSIQGQFISVFITALSWFVEQFSDIFKSKNEHRITEAEEKAKDADEKACQETDENSMHAYRAQAAVWRQVAEQYKEDLAELSARVSELEEKTKSNINNEVHEFTPDVEFKEDKASFSFKKWVNKIPKVNL